MAPQIRGRRQVISVSPDISLTRYERAHSKGCWDLRSAGVNSMVTVFMPTGEILFTPSLNFEDIPKEEKNFFQLVLDRKAAAKNDKRTTF